MNGQVGAETLTFSVGFALVITVTPGVRVVLKCPCLLCNFTPSRPGNEDL